MNYSEIVAEITAFANRDDAEVTDRIPTFIKLAEAKMNRAFRVGNLVVVATTPAVADAEYYAKPDDCQGIRYISYDGKTMNYATPRYMEHISNLNGLVEKYYTDIADQFRIYPTIDSGDIEIAYYKKVTPLNETDTTNWISDDHPDLYIYGALAELMMFVKNKEEAAIWHEAFKGVTSDIIDSDNFERWSGDDLRIRAG